MDDADGSNGGDIDLYDDSNDGSDDDACEEVCQANNYDSGSYIAASNICDCLLNSVSSSHPFHSTLGKGKDPTKGMPQ